MGEVYLPSADQLIQAAFVRAWLGLYWHYKEIIRALEQGDEQWIIPTPSQPEADFAQLLAFVPPCEMWRWVCLSSVTFLALSVLEAVGPLLSWLHPLCQPGTHSAHPAPEQGVKGEGGVTVAQTGNPKVQQCCQGWLSTWQALIIQRIFKIKCSLHSAGESSWHSIQLAAPAGLCFGEQPGLLIVPLTPTQQLRHELHHSPLPSVGFHCRGAVQTHLWGGWRSHHCHESRVWGHRSLALLPPVPTLPAAGSALGMLKRTWVWRKSKV